jgi:sulfite exporter TauE/SafE
VFRHALYLGGKLFTYAFLGALAGLLGRTLLAGDTLFSSQARLSYVAGGVLVVIGVGMLDLLPHRPLLARRVEGWSFAKQLYGQLFATPGLWGGFSLGVVTGFLPCPITLAMLGLAAAGSSVLGGIATLVGLGLGTMPALLVVGGTGTALMRARRVVPLRGAGVVVIALGVITLLRPTGVFCHILPTLELGPVR